MPVIWGNHNNSDIFLNVGIIDAVHMPSTNLNPLSAPPAIPTPRMFKALIDTGAQKTMISTNVIQVLGLNPLGKVLISGVGPTAHYHNAFLFYVAFVIAFLQPGQTLVVGTSVAAQVSINLNPIFGAEIPSTGGLFDVLLGMDVISTGQLVVGNGIYSFSF